MASIQDIQQDIIDEFDMFEEWMGKYEHIIDLGKSLPLIEEQFKTEDNLIKGCQSRVCLLYTSPSPRDLSTSRMPSSA